MNYQAIIGRVVRDPVYGQTAKGQSYLSFDIAVDRDGAEGADFFRCVAWAGLADSANKYLRQGRLVYVSGRNTSDDYEKDGVKRKTWTLHVRDLQYLDSPSKVPQGDRQAAPPPEDQPQW